MSMNFLLLLLGTWHENIRCFFPPIPLVRAVNPLLVSAALLDSSAVEVVEEEEELMTQELEPHFHWNSSKSPP